MGRPEVDGNFDVPYEKVREVERFLKHTRFIGIAEGRVQIGDYNLTDEQRDIISSTHDAYRHRDVDHWTIVLDTLYVSAFLDTRTYNQLNEMVDGVPHVFEAMSSEIEMGVRSLYSTIDGLKTEIENMKNQIETNKIEVFYQICESQVQFSGIDTTLIKDYMRKSGGYWDGNQLTWVMPSECGMRFMLENARRVSFRSK